MKIPLIFGMDVIHGYESVFPIPLGLSCNWDMDAIKGVHRLLQKSSADGICWTFSPMVDICHLIPGGDALPKATVKIPISVTRLQSNGAGLPGRSFPRIIISASCVKHYVLWRSEAGRDYNSPDMSYSRMFNEYLPPCQRWCGCRAGSVMASFNDVNGACNNPIISDDRCTPASNGVLKVLW